MRRYRYRIRGKIPILYPHQIHPRKRKREALGILSYPTRCPYLASLSKLIHAKPNIPYPPYMVQTPADVLVHAKEISERRINRGWCGECWYS